MSATQPVGTPPDDTADDDLKLVLPGRVLPAAAGWTWIAEGWSLFAKSPVMWVISIVLLLIAAIVLGFVPIVGHIAFQLLTPVISAGFVVACRSLERGGEFELEHLLAGFKTRFGNLAVVGLLTMVGWIAIFLVFAMFAGFSILTALFAGNAENILGALAASSMTILLGTLVALALSVPLIAAYWFAPALVVMHGMAPIAAMKASFAGCMRNFVPFLVYGIVMTVFAVIAMIPLGLGFLVWLPLAITSTYAAYRAIFTGGPGEALA
jgi:uncharacterized membrane protein